MALTVSTNSELGASAPAFELPGVDGLTYSLDSFNDAKALLVIFMCNHCPYVIAVHERLSALASEFAPKGLRVVGINSNDPNYRVDDSFENMIKTAREWSLPFPYLFDESQKVARAYDAVCTPDPYLYEKVGADFVLRYRGRIDDSWKDESQVREPSLRLAIAETLDGKKISHEIIPSMGCSIKWKK